MKWLDAHCHLSDARIFDSAPELIQEAIRCGVETMVLGGVDPQEWNRQKALQLQFPKNVILNFGLHPWTVEKLSRSEIDSSLQQLESELSFAQGLGETGLDFASRRDPASFENQRYAFREQIRMSIRVGKPLVLHLVHAHEEAIQILTEEKANRVPLMIHSYSGNATQLDAYLQLGSLISYSGTLVRRDGYEKVKKALARTPLDRLLLETDSPDQSWEEEGENTPSRVLQVYEAAAQILGIPVKNLCEKVAENLSKIY